MWVVMMFAAGIGIPAAAWSSARQVAEVRQTVWQGVYTAAQADRGRAAFLASCASCHGGGSAKPLNGETFLGNWMDDSVDSLFTKVKTAMPLDAPASLTDAVYVDVVSYILQANTFPAGNAELPPDHSALAAIRIEGKDGPRPVPSAALVRTSGCLKEGAGGVWSLTGSIEPVRTRDPEASTQAQLAEMKSERGTQTFKLMGMYVPPHAQAGHHVEAKGFLVRSSQGHRINVTVLTTITAECDW